MVCYTLTSLFRVNDPYLVYNEVLAKRMKLRQYALARELAKGLDLLDCFSLTIIDSLLGALADYNCPDSYHKRLACTKKRSDQ
jgi:hypothetical protein